jgi:hypothetical protein
MDMWDDGACETIASGLGRVARKRGGLSILPFALKYSAAHQLFLGEFGIAHQLVQEAETITVATRGVPVADFSVLLAAWRGERERTNALRAAMIEAGTAHGEGFASRSPSGRRRCCTTGSVSTRRRGPRPSGPMTPAGSDSGVDPP